MGFTGRGVRGEGNGQKSRNLINTRVWSLTDTLLPVSWTTPWAK